MTIKINHEGIRIRPSAVDSFHQCAYQWGKTFLEGVQTIPNSRAAIGTSVHAGVEQMWNESIAAKAKVHSLSAMTDAAMEAWKDETHDGVSFDEGEDENTAAVEIVKGIEAFVDDIVPFAAIPKAVETRVTVGIENPFITELSGTIDYITEDTIADVKTSKRKPTTSNYSTQQSLYKFLANANGYNVEHNLIQGVVFGKRETAGMVLTMDQDIDVHKAKTAVNTILQTMEVIATDKVPIDVILRGNPKHHFCSNKYCAIYPCKFVKGE